MLEGDSVFELDEAARRRALEETRALREEHERCLAGATGAERDGLRGWIDRLDAESLAYEDSGRLAELAAGFRRRMDAQRSELRRLRAP